MASAFHHGLFLIITLILTLTQEGAMTSEADTPHEIVIGNSLNLTCNPPNIDQDKSKVEWIKDGEDDNVLNTDDQYIVNDDKRTLTIISAEPDDAGTYECRTTSAQPLTKHISAFFFKSTDLPEATCAEEGKDITLTCEANGKPFPTVQWLKDWKKLNDSKYDYKPNKDHISNAVLSFKNVNEHDKGMYTCQIFSDMGIVNTTTNVNVQGSCDGDGIGGGAITGIVFGVLTAVGLIGAAVYFVIQKR